MLFIPQQKIIFLTIKSLAKKRKKFLSTFALTSKEILTASSAKDENNSNNVTDPTNIFMLSRKNSSLPPTALFPNFANPIFALFFEPHRRRLSISFPYLTKKLYRMIWK